MIIVWIPSVYNSASIPLLYIYFPDWCSPDGGREGNKRCCVHWIRLLLLRVEWSQVEWQHVWSLRWTLVTGFNSSVKQTCGHSSSRRRAKSNTHTWKRNSRPKRRDVYSLQSFWWIGVPMLGRENKKFDLLYIYMYCWYPGLLILQFPLPWIASGYLYSLCIVDILGY